MNYLYISPFAGAIIGYFTNWLAIKMLFRPYKQKYIGKFKVPFTPGLVPKEREHLAAKIGQTISNHILTEDVLKETLQSKDFSNIVEDLYSSVANELNQDIIIKEYLIDKMGIENYDSTKKYLVAELSKSIDLINSPTIREKISTSINNKLIEILEKDSTKESVSKLLQDFINNTSEESINNFINDKEIADKQINELISTEALDNFKNTVHDNLPFFINIIKNNLEDEYSSTNATLKKLAYTVIEANVGKVGMVFIKPDHIYKNMRGKFIKYITEDQDDLFDKTDEFIDQIVENQVNDITSKIPNDNIMHIINNIVNKYLTFDGSLKEEIEKAYPDLTIRSKQLISKNVSNFFDNEFLDIKELAMEKIIFTAENTPISKIGNQFNNIPKEKIIDIGNNVLKTAVEKNSIKIINGINIEEIAETQINAFPIEEIEHIVVDVANKELKMITYLGGVLGFIIGALPLLHLFFN